MSVMLSTSRIQAPRQDHIWKTTSTSCSAGSCCLFQTRSSSMDMSHMKNHGTMSEQGKHMIHEVNQLYAALLRSWELWSTHKSNWGGWWNQRCHNTYVSIWVHRIIQQQTKKHDDKWQTEEHPHMKGNICPWDHIFSQWRQTWICHHEKNQAMHMTTRHITATRENSRRRESRWWFCFDIMTICRRLLPCKPLPGLMTMISAVALLFLYSLLLLLLLLLSHTQVK